MKVGTWYVRRIYVATTEEDRAAVHYVQRVLGMVPTGELDQETRSKLRGLQHLFGLPITGILDDATAQQVQRIFPEGAISAVPEEADSSGEEGGG